MRNTRTSSVHLFIRQSTTYVRLLYLYRNRMINSNVRKLGNEKYITTMLTKRMANNIPEVEEMKRERDLRLKLNSMFDNFIQLS